MRIIPEKPMQILDGVVRDHLTRVWVNPIELFPIFLPGVTPGPISGFFSDPALSMKMDLGSLTTRLVLSADRSDKPKIAILAAIGLPDQAPPNAALLITGEAEVVLAMQADASIHPDGTIQIYGAEPGIMVFRVDQIKKQVGKALIKEGTPVRSMSIEKRDAGGVWSGVPARFNFPLSAVRSMQQD